MMRRSTRRPAAVLLLVLWALTVLSLTAGGLCFVLRQNLAIANLGRDRVVAHQLARAGVERAIAEVMDDTDATDATIDPWYDKPSAFEEIELTGGTFSVMHDGYEASPQAWYGVGDEAAKLNINVATRAQLMKLPDMTAAIAGAIIDWRDRNEEPELDGVERAYYSGQRHPYDIRNGPFKTVRELLLVRGVTPELFYGEDRNGNGLLDENEDNGSATEPPDNADGRLDRGWQAYVTVYSYDENVTAAGQERLNINEAGAGDLTARLMLEPWAAQSVVKAREQHEFEHLADLLDVERDPNTQHDPDADHYVRSDEEKDKPITTAIFQDIVDLITVKRDRFLVGRVNVNTAPRAVLLVLPDIDGDTADAIINKRESLAGFSSIGQLLDIKAIDRDAFAELEDFVTVRTSVFRIQSQGSAVSGSARATIECVVDRREDRPRVLYWLESAP